MENSRLFTGGLQVELKTEIARLKKEFVNADESKLKALEGLIEQAAYERLYLKQLNEQALFTGLVEFHPENTKLQRSLPVSQEIARHSAALTNIMDKLIKHLSTGEEDDETGLEEYI
jgi:heme oxygenase